jgi:hypothetical protein
LWISSGANNAREDHFTKNEIALSFGVHSSLCLTSILVTTALPFKVFLCVAKGGTRTSANNSRPQNKTTTGGNAVMKNKQIKWIGAATLGLVLMAVAAPSAFTEPAAPTLTANVVSQQCQGGDDVSVALTAVLSPNRTGVLYAWDLDNDGVFETVPDPNPTVTALFPDEMVTTASVAVMRNGRVKLTDSITFQTLRCR